MGAWGYSGLPTTRRSQDRSLATEHQLCRALPGTERSAGGAVPTSQLTPLRTARTAAAPDDADSRPGSATSLLRTIIGCYLRRLGGWIAAAALLDLMTTVGISQARTRTAVLRVR